MSIAQPPDGERRTATHGERRDHTPPGRLRRLRFEYHWGVLSLGLGIVLLLVLFASTTAFAVNERFKRDVSRIAYARDARALQFLLEQEARSLRDAADTVASLESRVDEALNQQRPYLVVSIAERRLWYLSGNDTVFAAPVAVGSGATLVMGGTTRRFQTPRGRMTITRKERDPVWVPPDWHYISIARQRGLKVVDMSNAAPDALTRRGFPAGQEPIADGVIYIPPYGSPQRRYTGVLGVAKLEMRDGYYFHGTNNEASVGTAASHGCIRLRRDDILWMYDNIPVGTPVYIY